MKLKKISRAKKIRLIEFLIIGLGFGITEDILAVLIATDSELNFKILGIVFVIALPFAFISEVVVDHPRFWEKFIPKRKEHDEI